MNFYTMGNFAMNNKSNKIICPVCGKEFSPAPEHSYHLDNKEKLVCSYNCERQWEKNQKPQRSERSSRKAGVAIRFVETGEEFKSIAECAEHLNTACSIINHCIKNGYLYKGIHIERVKKDD